MTRSVSHLPIHLALKDKKLCSYVTADGTVFYRRVGQVLVVACDPRSDSAEGQQKVWHSFNTWACSQSFKICGYYFSKSFCGSLSDQFKVYKAGVSRSLNLSGVSLQGDRSKEIRRGLNQLTKNQWAVVQVSGKRKKQFFHEVKQLEGNWLKGKGSYRINFLLSRVKLSEASKWFLLKDKNGQLLAFLSAYEKENIIYLDHLIQGRDAPKMSLDALVSSTIKELLTSSVDNLSFGFNAFIQVPKSTVMERFLNYLGRCEGLYNSQGIYRFKKKYTNEEEERFLIVDHSLSTLGAGWSIFRATFAWG